MSMRRARRGAAAKTISAAETWIWWALATGVLVAGAIIAGQARADGIGSSTRSGQAMLIAGAPSDRQAQGGF